MPVELTCSAPYWRTGGLPRRRHVAQAGLLSDAAFRSHEGLPHCPPGGVSGLVEDTEESRRAAAPAPLPALPPGQSLDASLLCGLADAAAGLPSLCALRTDAELWLPAGLPYPLLLPSLPSASRSTTKGSCAAAARSVRLLVGNGSIAAATRALLVLGAGAACAAVRDTCRPIRPRVRYHSQQVR